MAPSLDAKKLVMVLGMLGSAHDGEIASAGRRASEMLQKAGLTWRDVIKAPPFDKTAYQREYMRRKRARQRNANV